MNENKRTFFSDLSVGFSSEKIEIKLSANCFNIERIISSIFKLSIMLLSDNLLTPLLPRNVLYILNYIPGYCRVCSWQFNPGPEFLINII